MGARQSCSTSCDKCAADCARPQNGSLDDFDEERGGDPAGATFEETLEDLNPLDKHLMLFCGTSNLAAVRWLLYLGAHWDASDANGTTCLHVACRAGVMSIVKDLMQHRELLEISDNAGWTALHVAVLMGRREVVVRLLQAGASSQKRNVKGQLPAELCADNATFQALRAFELHSQQFPGKPWTPPKDMGVVEDLIANRLQYEPFFVPRQPLIRAQQFKKEFQKIGTAMFNRQPGYGVAFLVASGVTRDYPVDMSTFMRRSKVSIAQVGSFLGEAFSLSHTIRLEFMNSVGLQDTGVVGALTRVLRMLQLPEDLQKINRLVHSVARIWWRQHERLLREVTGDNKPPQKKLPVDPQAHVELGGLELKQYITSSDVLHQLMFTTVMLHWFVHRDGTGSKHEMEFDRWKALNRGIESGTNDVPEHVQRRIHTVVSQAFIGELAVASAGRNVHGSAAGGGPEEGAGPADDATGSVASVKTSPVFPPGSCLEGWGQMVGSGFPRPSGLTGVGSVTYRHVSNIFSEVTGSPSSVPGALGSRGRSPVSPLGPTPPGTATHLSGAAASMGGLGSGKREDVTWLTLSHTLLFFSAAHAATAPHAFVELQKLIVVGFNAETRVLTLAASPDEDRADVTPIDGSASPMPAGSGRSCTSGSSSARAGGPVSIVLLLPDGRWQELSLPKLELRLPTAAEFDLWQTHLTAACLPCV